MTAGLFIGFGTLSDLVAIITGSAIGMALSGRFSPSTRSLITDVLALTILPIAGSSIAPLFSPALGSAVGQSIVFAVILIALIGGTMLGAGLRLERRLDRLGEQLIKVVNRRTKIELTPERSARFAQGFVGASLLFCVGPLTVLGSLSEGLGRGPDQLITKATLDFFTAVALASSLGWGVMAAGLSVLVIQGTLTLLGAWLGDLFSVAQIDALSVTGGIMLVGLVIRLLELKPIRIADMLPGLLVAPLLVGLIEAIR